MTSRARLLGHPVHPMLLVFPFGLFATAVVFEVLALTVDREPFATVACWMIASGLAGGALASVPGWTDGSAIPSGTRAERVGIVHGLGNTLVVALFLGSWLLRRAAPTPEALGTGWLGAERVDRLDVGVDDGAHLDAPNSLSARPARS